MAFRPRPRPRIRPRGVMECLGWLRFCGQLSGRFVVPKGRIGLCPEGTGMIVARQFIAWNTPKKGEPSRRDGVNWATPHIRRPWSKNVLSTESYRSLRDGFFVWHTPGNKLPGYDHSVPPGQKTLNTCPRIRRRISWSVGVLRQIRIAPRVAGMLEGRCIPRCNPLADLSLVSSATGLPPDRNHNRRFAEISSATSAQFNAGLPRDRSTPLG
jgi:hypothetical protein